MYGYYGNNYGYNPAAYYPSQQPQMQTPQAQQAPQSSVDERIYVQGEGAAKAYLVAPGNTVTLWDTERQSIYIKTVGPTGIPAIQRLDYVFAENAPQKAASEYEDRIRSIESSIEKLKRKINAFEGVKSNERNESDADDSGI